MTELEQALLKYGTTIKHFDDDPVYLHLINNLGKVVAFERPDGYLAAENDIYIGYSGFEGGSNPRMDT